MPVVRLKDNEPFESGMRRFKRTIEKIGLLTELRAREFYEKPTAERKRKKSSCRKKAPQADPFSNDSYSEILEEQNKRKVGQVKW